MLPIETAPGIRKRKRSLAFFEPAGYSGVRNSAGVSDSRWYSKVEMQQTTIDKAQTGWPILLGLLNSKNVTNKQKRDLRKRNYGGEFLSERHNYNQFANYYSLTKTQLGSTYFAYGMPYLGRPVADIKPSSLLWPSLSADDINDLWGKGSTAIKNCAPLMPEVSLSQSIGELREGLPRLAYKLGTVQQALNSGSSNFLGWQFGVKPFISDFNNIKNAVEKYDQKISQFEKESGELLHRKFRFDVEESRTLQGVTTVPAWPAPPSPVAQPSGIRTETLIERKESWFSGAFSYYFPHLRTGLDQLKTWCTYYGINPTADTIWNLSPYSWLMDWFGNFGDVIFNASYLGQNNQVMNYGYLCQTTTATKEVSFVGPLGTSIQEFQTIRKLRIGASPFGFGLSDSDLSLSQQAILAALGITRVT